MKSVLFPLIAASLILGGCSAKTNKQAEAATVPEKITWTKDEYLGAFVCGTNVLIRHNNGLYLESGEELKKPDYKASVVSNKEGGFTTAYDYDEKNNTLSVTKSSRYYGAKPIVTVKCN